MSPEKLLSRHTLENGLVLEFWDLSRPVAGDRCQVVVEARVPVAVADVQLPPEWQGQKAKIIAGLGKEVVFTKQEVRNFVAVTEAPALLQQVTEQLLSSLTPYLGHPHFASRLILKKFADLQEKQRWQH